MKRRQLALVFLVVLLLGTVALSQLAVGNFNAATGFSGRNGFTCTSCHNVPDLGPLGSDEMYDPPAEVTVTGLPSEWEHGTEYELTITVTGGPPALPSPAPQGGFEVESDAGFFWIPEGMEDFIEVYAEDGTGVTYTAAGTQMREWRVMWAFPFIPHGPTDNIFGGPWMTTPPEDATLWVAAMAANGNHVVAAQQSDQGELGDSVDNISITIPPSQATLDAWLEYRLLPAVPDDVEDSSIEVEAFEAFEVKGRQLDDDATHVAFQFNGGEWERIEAVGEWKIPFGNGLSPGEHTLAIRAESVDRISETITITIHSVQAESSVEASFPSLLGMMTLLFAMGWGQRR